MAPDRLTSPTDTEVRSARRYREHRVPRGPHHIYAREYPGQEPATVLLHGFPDNLHLYDRLVPELAPRWLAPRRVVTFDFLGWGASDKPAGHRYTAANQVGDPIDADPFEILAHSEGRRATDAIEVFPAPSLDADGVVTCRFLAHGVRHIPGAHDAIDGLTLGEVLSVLPDPQNEVDRLAVLLRTGGHRLVGYVPAYLTSLIHRPLDAYGSDAVQVNVEHIGDRNGPSHLRLLCRLAPMPSG